MTGRLRLAALLLAALLQACASQQPAAPVPEPAASSSERELWETHSAAVAKLRSWEARGKVAFTLPDEAGTASLLWEQAGEQSRLRLAGPLGANAVSLRSDGALISLTRDGIERLYPADAAPWLGDGRLLPIPVNSIQHWLRGIPDPRKPVAHLETEGGLARQLVQDGWNILYEAYASSVAGTLPVRLRAEAPQAGLMLKILIRGWEPDAAGP